MNCTDVGAWLFFEGVFDVLPCLEDLKLPWFQDGGDLQLSYTAPFLNEENSPFKFNWHWEDGQFIEGGQCTWVEGGPASNPLSRYTWPQLKVISDEIAKASSQSAAVEIAKQHGLVDDGGKLAYDNLKQVQLSDGTRANVHIVGIWQDAKTNGGKAGLTFAFKDVVAQHAMNPSATNEGGWESSEMRQYLNEHLFAQLPADLQTVIAPVNKFTNNVGFGVDLDDGTAVTGTSDKLWLFSLCEVIGIDEEWDYPLYTKEGRQYKLYSDHGVTADNCSLLAKKDAFSGAASEWLLRTPNPDYVDEEMDGAWESVGTDGDVRFSSWVSGAGGVAPAFCL